jgi:hypothetical protein
MVIAANMVAVEPRDQPDRSVRPAGLRVAEDMVDLSSCTTSVTNPFPLPYGSLFR